jgi:uncharacterized membrane protein YesL
MLPAVKVFLGALGDVYYELFLLVGVNLLWLVGMITIIPSVPATAAVFYLTNQMVKGESIGFVTFFRGFRDYFAQSWLLFAVSQLISLVILANVVFYINMDSELLRLIGILWAYVMVFWLCVQMYTFPLLIEQGSRGVFRVLRNAVLLTLDNLMFTLTLLVILVLFVALSSALVIVIPLLLACIVATVQNKAALLLLEKYR